MTTLNLRKSIHPSPLRLGFLLVPLALACFTLSPTPNAFGVTFPDGGYPGFNTAEGDYALAVIVNSSGTGRNNTAIGYAALTQDNGGSSNTATGYYALFSNTSGNYNTATGSEALRANTTGYYNTAHGVNALDGNTTGRDNTATGAYALFSNTNGYYNTASGVQALYNNTTGGTNTANGFDALYSNTTGGSNTATGAEALSGNTIGLENTATGYGALYSNSTGTNNTANGASALFSNTSGGNNIASGVDALYFNTTGYYNTADGVFSLYHNTVGHDNTGSGNQALFNNTSGNFNIALGNAAGYNLTTGSNNIVVGAGVPGTAGEANTTRIGKSTQKKTFIGGISGKTVASGVGVIINSSGQLGTIQSSARFKDHIRPMDKASQAILALKPVTFRYKEELDPDGIPQFGLIAEEVDKVNPDLVVRDEDGKVNTVRYEAVNAMLLNEFLKEHGQMQQLKATVAHQQKQIEALTATVQKVSDQVALSKPASLLVANP